MPAAGKINFLEGTTPATPDPNYSVLYVDDADGKLKKKDDAGSITTYDGGAGGINQLTGDVTAGPGTGSQAATVIQVGGVVAASVATGVNLANAATDANIASTIVRRDASGNFAAGVINASISGTSSNITGVVAIANGGTGQSNQQAGLNNLTDIGSHSNGDVLQLLAGNAQFAPFTPSGTTGTPNTLAYYDPSGDLMTLPQWTVDPLFQQVTFDVGDIDSPSSTYLLKLGGQLQALDTVAGDLSVIKSNVQNAGAINNTFRFIEMYSANNGTIGDIEMASLVMQNDSVTNSLTMINLQENLNTVGSQLTGIQIGSTSAAVSGKTGISINFSGSAGTTVFPIISSHNGFTASNGVSILNHNTDNTSVTTGSWNGINLTQQGTISQNLNALFLNSQGAITQQLDFLALNVSANVGNNLNGLNMQIQNTATVGASGGNITAVQLNNAAVFTGSGNQVIGANIQNTAIGDSVRGFEVSNNATLDEAFNGLFVNNSGNVRTGTGIDITMSGNATDDTQGLRINVNNLTSTNNRVRSIDAQGATYSFSNLYRPASGLFVDSGNNNFTEYRIANGSPITNTDVLVNNNIVAYLAEDDQAIGPVGLGIATLNSISLVGIADTKTIDLVRGFLVVASIQNPGYADNGTLAEFQGIVYAGAASGGGNTAVTSATGLIMPTGFDGYAASNYGIRIQGTTAENYINKLAIGTPSETAGTGLALDTYGQIGISAIGSGLSIAEGSNAKMGVSTLVAGVITVSTTAVTANSRIFITNQNPSALVGVLAIDNIVAATSFDIVSTEPTETSDIAWMIVESI